MLYCLFFWNICKHCLNCLTFFSTNITVIIPDLTETRHSQISPVSDNIIQPVTGNRWLLALFILQSFCWSQPHLEKWYCHILMEIWISCLQPRMTGVQFLTWKMNSNWLTRASPVRKIERLEIIYCFSRFADQFQFLMLPALDSWLFKIFFWSRR